MVERDRDRDERSGTDKAFGASGNGCSSTSVHCVSGIGGDRARMMGVNPR